MILSQRAKGGGRLSKTAAKRLKKTKKNYMLSQRINHPRIRFLHFTTLFATLFVLCFAIFATVRTRVAVLVLDLY